MPGGRPTTYGPHILEKTQEYIENYEQLGDVMPSIAGLAVFLEKGRQSIYDWSNNPENKEFSYILARLLAKQEQILFNKGLTNDFNATIVKLALGKHGYTDRQETEHKGNVGVTDMTEEQLNIKLKTLLNASE